MHLMVGVSLGSEPAEDEDEDEDEDEFQNSVTDSGMRW